MNTASPNHSAGAPSDDSSSAAPAASPAASAAPANPSAASSASVAPAASPIASARALLKELQEQYIVFRECRPLAIGVDKQLLAARPDIERKLLRLALRTHTASVRYLKAVEKGSQRFDLEGNAVAELAEEHRAHAAETLRERFRKEAGERRAKEAAERAAKAEVEAEARRAEKLNQLAAKFAKR